MLYIVSTYGKPKARKAWQQAPLRHRMKTHIFNGTVRLGRRPIPISEEHASKFAEELDELIAQGIIELREGGPDGRVFASFEDVASEAGEEEEPEEDEEEEEEEEEDEEEVEPDKPIERMNKAELVAYAMTVTEAEESELEGMTKRQIMELLS